MSYVLHASGVVFCMVPVVKPQDILGDFVHRFPLEKSAVCKCADAICGNKGPRVLQGSNQLSMKGVLSCMEVPTITTSVPWSAICLTNPSRGPYGADKI